MPFLGIGIALACFGLANAAYLAYGHRKRTLICPLDHDCTTVTESRWGTFLGIRNEAWGLLYYGAAFTALVLSAAAPSLTGIIIRFFPLFTGVGLLYSVFLLGVQAFVIRDYCFYCFISALITFLLFTDSLFLN